MTNKDIIFEYLDRQEYGSHFTGYQLANHIRAMTGNICYPATALRYVREYRAKTRRRIVNIDKAKSLYEMQS